MNASHRLALATLALQGADQTVLAALPLIVAVGLGAGPGLTGALVAAQGAAWLLVSLPAGAWLDQAGRAWALGLAVPAAALGFGLAFLAQGSILGLAMGSFLGSGAVVVGVLAVAALVPGHVAPPGRPGANARIEMARGLGTLVAAPLAGVCAAQGAPGLALLLAAGIAALGLAATQGLPKDLQAPPGPRPALLPAIRAGARFVRTEPHLRAIAACAVFWNIGFFALVAIAVPLALGPLGLSPAETGLALGGYGAGLLLGAALAPRVLRLLPPGWVLVLGPSITLLAVALLWMPWVPGIARLTLAQGLIGFGPMLWQVTQTTLRQAVTPPELLGRVGASLQVAVFGVRPLGALAGGALGAWGGPWAGLALATLCFALSVLVVLRPPLRTLRRFPKHRPATPRPPGGAANAAPG